MKSCKKQYRRRCNIFDLGATLFGGSQEIENTKSEINHIFGQFNQNFQKLNNYTRSKKLQSTYINSKIKDLLNFARLIEASSIYH